VEAIRRLPTTANCQQADTVYESCVDLWGSHDNMTKTSTDFMFAAKIDRSFTSPYLYNIGPFM